MRRSEWVRTRELMIASRLTINTLVINTRNAGINEQTHKDVIAFLTTWPFIDWFSLPNQWNKCEWKKNIIHILVNEKYVNKLAWCRNDDLKWRLRLGWIEIYWIYWTNGDSFWGNGRNEGRIWREGGRIGEDASKINESSSKIMIQISLWTKSQHLCKPFFNELVLNIFSSNTRNFLSFPLLVCIKVHKNAPLTSSLKHASILTFNPWLCVFVFAFTQNQTYEAMTYSLSRRHNLNLQWTTESQRSLWKTQCIKMDTHANDIENYAIRIRWLSVYLSLFTSYIVSFSWSLQIETGLMGSVQKSRSHIFMSRSSCHQRDQRIK